jgi:hypothetical protein
MIGQNVSKFAGVTNVKRNCIGIVLSINNDKE